MSSHYYAARETMRKRSSSSHSPFSNMMRKASSLRAPTSDQRITLVTCYPFDGWTRSPWRYIATFKSR